MISRSNYAVIKEFDESIENLLLLTLNRQKHNIFLLSSNPFSVTVAMDQGYCAIPVTRFQNPNRKDYQLNLVENYLLKLRYSKNMKSKNDIDFGFLKYGPIKNALKGNQENKVVKNV